MLSHSSRFPILKKLPLYIATKFDAALSDPSITEICFAKEEDDSLVYSDLSEAITTVLPYTKVISLGMDLDFDETFAQDQTFAQAIAINTTLTRLALSSCSLNDVLIRALAANTTLQSLDLYENDVGDANAIILASNHTLKSLCLCVNAIGDEGAKALAKNNTLQNLDISANDLRIEGAKALAANITLQSLDISCNRIQNEGAKALAGNSTLKKLIIRNTHIGKEGMLALDANDDIEVQANILNDAGAESLINPLENQRWIKVLAEKNPIKRHNLRRELGCPTEVPSLLRLSVFAVKSNNPPPEYVALLPEELRAMLAKNRV